MLCARACRKKASEWDAVEATPAVGSRWDATPGLGAAAATPAWGDGATPGLGSRWDATPGAGGAAAPTPRRNRWDDATPGQVGVCVCL